MELLGYGIVIFVIIVATVMQQFWPVPKEEKKPEEELLPHRDHLYMIHGKVDIDSDISKL